MQEGHRCKLGYFIPFSFYDSRHYRPLQAIAQNFCNFIKITNLVYYNFTETIKTQRNAKIKSINSIFPTTHLLIEKKIYCSFLLFPKYKKSIQLVSLCDFKNLQKLLIASFIMKVLIYNNIRSSKLGLKSK